MTQYYRICWKCLNGEVEAGLPANISPETSLERVVRYLNARYPATYHWIEYLDFETVANQKNNKRRIDD